MKITAYNIPRSSIREEADTTQNHECEISILLYGSQGKGSTSDLYTLIVHEFSRSSIDSHCEYVRIFNTLVLSISKYLC